MKTLILGLAALYILGAALPAAADDRDHRDGAAIVHPAMVHHHRHRVVWFDRHHHRHVSWR